LRGEGDAQRTNIYAQAYGADPEFYQFFRSLQSYRTALGNSGTSLVLSPDSEFFRYFGADTLDGATPQPAAPGGIAPLPSSEVPAVSIDVPPVDEPIVTLDQATPAITAEPPTPEELIVDGTTSSEEPAAAQ